MSKKKRIRQMKARCALCNYEFVIEIDNPEASTRTQLQCPNCAAYQVYSVGKVKSIVRVVGTNANEVKDVATTLTEKVMEKHKESIRNPWISGSFYLASIVVIATLFLVVARMVHPLAFPIVLVGALLGVSLIGAFQLRQDKSLSEKNFLSLMALSFKQLKFIQKKDSDKTQE